MTHEAPITFQISSNDQLQHPECKDTLGVLLEWTKLIEAVALDMCDKTETVALHLIHISGKRAGSKSMVMATPPAARAVAQYASAVAEQCPSHLEGSAKDLLSLQRQLKSKRLNFVIPKQVAFTESIPRAELTVDSVDFGDLKPSTYREHCDLYGEPIQVSVDPGRVWLRVRGESKKIRVSLTEDETRAVALRMGRSSSGRRVLIHGIGTYRVTDHCLMKFEANIEGGLDVSFTDRPNLLELDDTLKNHLVAGRSASDFHLAMAQARAEGVAE